MTDIEKYLTEHLTYEEMTFLSESLVVYSKLFIEGHQVTFDRMKLFNKVDFLHNKLAGAYRQKRINETEEFLKRRGLKTDLV